MAESKRSLFEVHFHSHGDVQLGPRSMGRSEEKAEKGRTEEGGGLSVGMVALAVIGVAVAAAFVRRRQRESRQPVSSEQKNLDRWIPTR